MIEDLIKKIVKEECEKDTNIYKAEVYDEHFVPMVNYAKQLARKLNADEEIVEIAAWLHDIGSIIGDYENHHVKGAEYAENLLKKFNYPQDKIERVKHCIMAHRGSKNVKKKTLEAEIIASADGMPHFDGLGLVSLFKLALITKNMGAEEARIFVRDKLKSMYNKMLPEAKEIIKGKYEAAMLVLG